MGASRRQNKIIAERVTRDSFPGDLGKAGVDFRCHGAGFWRLLVLRFVVLIAIRFVIWSVFLLVGIIILIRLSGLALVRGLIWRRRGRRRTGSFGFLILIRAIVVPGIVLIE